MTEYFYNLTTKQVEEGRQSPATELIGPFGSAEEARKALETVAARNESWDEDDKEWENGTSDS